MALYSRRELNIRTTTNFLLALASNRPECRPFLRKYYSASIMLPSDWIEVAEIYQVPATSVFTWCCDFVFRLQLCIICGKKKGGGVGFWGGLFGGYVGWGGGCWGSGVCVCVCMEGGVGWGVEGAVKILDCKGIYIYIHISIGFQSTHFNILWMVKYVHDVEVICSGLVLLH